VECDQEADHAAGEKLDAAEVDEHRAGVFNVGDGIQLPVDAFELLRVAHPLMAQFHSRYAALDGVSDMFEFGWSHEFPPCSASVHR